MKIHKSNMIIGITGKMGSGKSTLAQTLVEKHGFVEYSFAAPLKQIGEIFQFTHSQLYGTQQEKEQKHEWWGISARDFLQKVGTELFREKLLEELPDLKTSGSVWVDLFMLTYQKNPNVDYVISDVRFLNEAEMILKLGGAIVKTIRDLEEKNDDSTNITKNVMHKSETELSQIQYSLLIDNTKLTPAEAAQKVMDTYFWR